MMLNKLNILKFGFIYLKRVYMLFFTHTCIIEFDKMQIPLNASVVKPISYKVC